MIKNSLHPQFARRSLLVRAFCIGVALAKPIPLLADANVTNDQLLGAQANDADWLTYGHGYANQRHSGLQQIHRGNVSRLVPKWIYQTGVDGTFQTSPIVVDGVVYLTTPGNHIVALDGATGQVRWKYTHKMDTGALCCGIHNRGAAIGYGRVYEITADARLIAVDQQSGKLVWDVPVVDPASGSADAPQQVRNMDNLPTAATAKWPRFMGNMAPLVYDGLVIVGTTGAGYTSSFGEGDEKAQAAVGRPGPRSGMRAFISAYEADSGRLAWRWYSTKDKGWEGEYLSAIRRRGMTLTGIWPWNGRMRSGSAMPGNVAVAPSVPRRRLIRCWACSTLVPATRPPTPTSTDQATISTRRH